MYVVLHVSILRGGGHVIEYRTCDRKVAISNLELDYCAVCTIYNSAIYPPGTVNYL